MGYYHTSEQLLGERNFARLVKFIDPFLNHENELIKMPFVVRIKTVEDKAFQKFYIYCTKTRHDTLINI